MNKTLEEIRAAKKELEKAFLSLVVEFSEQNDVVIDGVYFNSSMIYSNGKPPRKLFTDVDVICRL